MDLPARSADPPPPPPLRSTHGTPACADALASAESGWWLAAGQRETKAFTDHLNSGVLALNLEAL